MEGSKIMARKKKEKFPWVKVVFNPDGYEVTMEQFEKINPRIVARASRAINKHRRILIKQLVREDRKDAERRREEERRSGQRPEGVPEDNAGVNELIDDFLSGQSATNVKVPAGNDEGSNTKTDGATRDKKD
jgi:hypothetical protein